jgi:hypothetical protein
MVIDYLLNILPVVRQEPSSDLYDISRANVALVDLIFRIPSPVGANDNFFAIFIDIVELLWSHRRF